MRNHKARLEGVKLLVEHKSDVDMKVDNGTNLLHLACNNPNMNKEIVEYLLKEMDRRLLVEKTSKLKGGITPFHLAVMNPRTDVDLVRSFIESKADPNTHDENGMNLLFASILLRKSPDLLIVDCLIENGAQIFKYPTSVDSPSHSPTLGYSALHAACSVDPLSVDLIKLVFEKSRKPAKCFNFSDSMTPLHLVCQHPSPSIPSITYLVENKFDPNLCESASFGWSSLHVACSNYDIPSPEIIKLLVELKADPLLKDKLDRSVLHLLVENRNSKLDWFQYFINLNVDPSSVDNQGKNVLQYAIEDKLHNNITPIVEYLKSICK